MLSTFKKSSRNLSDLFCIKIDVVIRNTLVLLYQMLKVNANKSSNNPFLLNDFNTKMYLPNLPIPKHGLKAVSIDSDILVFGKFKYRRSSSVIKYSLFTKN